jgi:Family of unknown function (DUF6186)
VSVVIGSDKLVGLAFWIAVVVLLCALEVAGHLPSSRIPSLEDLVARYLRRPLVRVSAIGLWLFAGWHLFSH